MNACKDEEKIAWKRIIALIIAMIASIFSGYFLCHLAENQNAVMIVAIMFSVFFGFLLVVIQSIPDLVLGSTRNWEDLQKMKKTTENRLNRQKLCCFLYLMIILFALIVQFIPKNYDEASWVYGIFVGLSTFGFLLSFSLPGALVEIQKQRYKAALDNVTPQALRVAIRNAKNT